MCVCAFVFVCVISWRYCSPSVLFSLIVSNEQIGQQLLSQPGLLAVIHEARWRSKTFMTSRLFVSEQMRGELFEVSYRAGVDQ